jgi:hypothetical protein
MSYFVQLGLNEPTHSTPVLNKPTSDRESEHFVAQGLKIRCYEIHHIW